MNGQPVAFPDEVTEQEMEKLEDAGAIEYDSWSPRPAGAVEYDSWSPRA